MTSSDATTSIAATFSRNLKAARKSAGMTQHDLAVALGRGDAMTVSRWERGENRPSDGYLIVLSEVLEREVAWFYTDHASQKEAA
jgi:transcriptional regulator with XRE-family HTH domain